MKKRIFSVILIILVIFGSITSGCGTVKSDPFKKGATYVCLYNQWDLYVAKVESESTLKVERWERYGSGSFEKDEDVGAITIDKEETFQWMDDSHEAFLLSIEDENNSNISDDSSLQFVNYNGDVATYTNRSLANGNYTYLSDKWDLYVATILSDQLIKIECWERDATGKKGDNFEYKRDVCLFKMDDADYQFKWIDSKHTAFFMTLEDEENIFWDDNEKKVVGFTNDLLHIPNGPAETEVEIEDTETETQSDGPVTYGSNDEYDYYIQDGEVTITSYKGSENEVFVPSQIDGNDVTAIGDSAFENNKSLTEISFWGAITKIGKSAFAGCTSLTDATIPSETTDIGAHAFENCNELETIILWGEPAIEEYAFAGCTSLTDISISSDTPLIGAHSFENCTSLAAAIIWGNTSIEEYAFAGCTSLTDMSISSGTDHIGDHAFDGCTSLSSVLIWDDNTKIGQDAFANCPNLEDIPQ